MIAYEMALYFNYKTPFDTLTSKFTKRIDSNSILEWFQSIWRTDLPEEELYQYYREKFGIHFYGLAHFVYNILDKKTQKPTSSDNLTEVIKILNGNYKGETSFGNCH